MVSINDVLKASKGVYVEDTFAQLWGRKLSNDYTIATYTGTLPATLTGTKAGYLHSYKIYGNTEQTGTPTPENPIVPQECGERTENMFSGEFSQFDNVGGTGNVYAYFYIPEDFTLTVIAKDTHTIPSNVYLGITKDGGQYTGGFTWAILQRETVTKGDIITVKSSTNGYHYVSMYQKNASTLNWILGHYYVMLVLGSTEPEDYIPYGYKLPLVSTGEDIDIYIGSDTLSSEEYVDSGIGKIYRMVDGTLTPVDPPVPFPQIPTSAGSTTISWAGEGLAPSEVELTYEKE